MASTKLTTAVRESIAKAMLAHRFGPDIKTLIADRADFAWAVYADVYPEHDRARMEELPVGWLPEQSSISVQFGTRFQAPAFCGAIDDGTFGFLPRPHGIWRRVQQRHVHACAKVYDHEHELSQLFERLAHRKSQLGSDIDSTRRQIIATLATIGTIARLKEVWPEAAPFAERFEVKRVNLPAVPTAQLNQLLGLTVESAEPEAAA